MPTVHLSRSFKIFGAFCIFAELFVTPAQAGVLPLFSPLFADSSSHKCFVQGEILLANDPYSLKSLFFDELKEDFHPKNGRNVAYGDTRFDAGCRYENFGYIGYGYQEAVVALTDKESLELLNMVQTKQELPLDKRYDVTLVLQGYETHNLVYAKSFHFQPFFSSHIWFGFALEGLYARKMQNGSVYGNAKIVGEKDYDFTAYAFYRYTHNYLYDLSVQSEDALGYATHLEMTYTYNEKFRMQFLANNILSGIYWKNLPLSDVTLSSKNKYYDENGYARYHPTLYGTELKKDYVQKLFRKYRLQGEYKKDADTFVFGTDMVKNIYLPYAEMHHRFHSLWRVKIGYESRFSSLLLGVNYKNRYFLHMRSDSVKKPSTLSLSFGAAF